MNIAGSYIAIAVSLVASTWCWWLIWRSEHSATFKMILTLIAGLPFLGPFLYLFVDMPPRHRHAAHGIHRAHVKQSRFLQRWNAREHVYLGWASVVFWALAVLAYWMNDWRPGHIQKAMFNLGFYTDVDVIFFALLVGAVLTFGAALRAKVALARKLREASNYLLHSTDQKQAAAE